MPCIRRAQCAAKWLSVRLDQPNPPPSRPATAARTGAAHDHPPVLHGKAGPCFCVCGKLKSITTTVGSRTLDPPELALPLCVPAQSAEGLGEPTFQRHVHQFMHRLQPDLVPTNQVPPVHRQNDGVIAA